MQIPNRRVHRMIETLRGIEQGTVPPSEAGKLAEYLETNFKSKSNYVKNKSSL